jgi:hypothetical protein
MPGGAFGSTTGLTSPSCSGVCPAAYFSPPAASSCTLCPAGKYSVEAGATTCKSCAPGLYGLPGVSTPNCSGPCVIVGGRYCPEALATSVGPMCPSGQFAAVGGGASCEACPAGSQCSSTGLGASTPCQAGAYSIPGSASCTVCPAGAFGDSAGLTSSMCSGACASIPGRYCGAGSLVSSGIACPIGRYSAAYAAAGTASECMRCPAGRFGSSSSTANSSDCTGACTAKAGRYCPVGATTDTGDACPAGQYSSTGGSASGCTLWCVARVHPDSGWQPGTVTGAHSLSVVTVCVLREHPHVLTCYLLKVL